MRVLYHHRTLGDGAEGVHIRAMVRAFRELGHEVRICALIGDPATGGGGQRRWSALRRFIPEPLYELAEVAYNVVGTGTLAQAIAAFDPHVVYDRYNSYSSAAVLAARRAGVPAILEVNSPVVHERTAWEHLPLRFPRLALRYERRILDAASRIVAVSTPLKDFLVDTHGVAPTRIAVLPNGADPQRFAPQVDASAVRERLGLAGKLVIGFSGTARPWHGLPLAVEALARLLPAHPDVHLLILGGGPSETTLRQLVDARGLGGHVCFVDRVAHRDVPAHVAAMDIALSPRATFYASPLKIVEYMAMGKAIVAPATGNIEDLLTHERSALLFEPENVEALAAALARLLADGALRAALGAAARQRVERDLNWKANAQAVVEMALRLRAGAPTGPKPRASTLGERDWAPSSL